MISSALPGSDAHFVGHSRIVGKTHRFDGTRLETPKVQGCRAKLIAKVGKHPNKLLMSTLTFSPNLYKPLTKKILGIDFFVGTCQDAVDQMLTVKGLLVAPSGPGLRDLLTQERYQQAVVGADMAIMDSGLMVMLWNLLEQDHLIRVSGLEYINMLLKQPSMKSSVDVMWIMAGPESSRRNLSWLNSQGITVPAHNVYLAPNYGTSVEDEVLLSKILSSRPDHVIVTVGGGVQEPLGYYLKQHLDYPVGIHCIGAAIAFLSGDQIKIPMWADRLCLGWLIRCISQPARYVPRYWEARGLFPLMLRHRRLTPQPISPDRGLIG